MVENCCEAQRGSRSEMIMTMAEYLDADVIMSHEHMSKANQSTLSSDYGVHSSMPYHHVFTGRKMRGMTQWVWPKRPASTAPAFVPGRR